MITNSIYVLLLSVALAMDASAVSVSLGMAGLAKNTANRLKIASTFGVFQGVLFALGYISLSFLDDKLTTFNSFISAILLALLGTKMIREVYAQEKNHCPHNVCLGLQCDKSQCDRTGQYRFLTPKLLLIFGIATSIDAFAAGISYGLVYNQIIRASLSIGIVTFILSFLGTIFGHKLKNKIGKYANLIGGIILFILAIKSLF